MKILPIAAAVTAALTAAGSAQAAVSDAEFAQLQAQMAALAERVEALEVENEALRELAGPASREAAPVAVASRDPQHWSERLSIKGDFRYRYEEIDVEGVDTRDRNRIRARVELQAKLPHNLTVGTGLSTGGDSPVSANQTLGGGGGRKDISLALAYVKWQALESLALSAGKMKNPFYRPQGTGLVWDSDFHPEGFGFNWTEGSLFLAGSANFLESDGRRDNQQMLWGLQGGIDLVLGDATLTTGLGYYDIPVAGNEAFYDESFFGNSFSCGDAAGAGACTYRHDYEEVEVFADLALNMLPLPVSLYAHLVDNQAVDDHNRGYLLGFNVGKAKERGSWQLGYQYQDLEADAVLGLVSDSNFAGGGTDGEGHKLYGTYAMHKQMQLGVTWFFNNETGADRLGEGLDYDRLIFDAKFKY